MHQSLDEILKLDQLKLPPYPQVDEIQWYPFTDSVGDPAYRVTVILRDDTPAEHRERNLTRAVETRIREALREAGVQEFPYIRTLTRAGLKWAEDNR